MRILALDSSGGACSAAMWADGEVRAARFERRERGHAERLMPMVLEVAREARTALAEVDLFAATTGPGGFTGVRVGLAALRGLALAAGRPMLGIDSFAALARATSAEARRGRRLLVLIDSKRSELFVQAFAPDLAPEGEPMLLTEAAIWRRYAGQALLLAGDGGARLLADGAARGPAVAFAENAVFIDARTLAPLAAELRAEARREAPRACYLHPPLLSRSAAGPL